MAKSSLTGASDALERRLAALPDIRLEKGAELAGRTTFRIGGPAEFLVEVPTLRALRGLLVAIGETGAPFCLLGLGSNVLIPDGGLAGVVARLTGYFRRVRVRGSLVSAGGAVPLAQLARRMASRGLVGLEALSGFPSTVGGAVYMNAGCYGTEVKDLLVRATLVDRRGRLRRIGVEDLGASYRRTRLQGGDEIVTRASLKLTEGDAEAALERITELNRRRWSSLPSGLANAGSIFRNPEGDHAGRLIEAAGLKGLRRGGAEISSRHANVIVNQGGALAADVLHLMAKARAEVSSAFGVALEPEVELLGELRDRWSQITETDKVG